MSRGMVGLTSAPGTGVGMVQGRGARWLRWLAPGVLVSLVLGLLVAPAASAATYVPTNLSVTVSPTTVTQGWGQTVNTTFSFCVPDAQGPGDSFQMTLPVILTNWPASFGIADSTGQDVITVTISDSSPAVATFTLTTYGAGVGNLCAIAKFGADSGATQVGTYPLAYTIGTTVLPQPPVSLVIQPQPYEPPPTNPQKLGWFTDNSNQCRVGTTGCLTWNFRTAAGNQGIVTISDTAPVGWRFTCANTYAATVTYGATRVFTDLDPATVLDGYSCSPGLLQFSLDTTGLAADEIYYLEFYATAAAPGGDGAVTYRNTATLTEGANPPRNLYAETASSYVGGSAEGDAIRIYKKDAAGNEANTQDTAVTLPDGTTGLIFTVRNVGTTDLTNIAVTDLVTQGGPPATVTGLTCDFSEAGSGGPTLGTTWGGPFPPETGFTCTATLSGVQGYSTDVATVTAQGNGRVESSDPYVAFTPIVVPSVSVGDFVWHDLDYDGLQSAGEPPVPGATLTLTGPTGQPVTDVDGNPVGPIVTGADGSYLFEKLPTLPVGQSYTVTVTPPAGYLPTLAEQGDDRALDSSTGSATSAADLSTNGAADRTLDFGFVQPIDLTLTKALTSAGPVYPGSTVTFTLTPHNNGPRAAMTGWSVTDVLPAGLTATAIDGGAAYTCVLASLTCTSTGPLAAGADGGPIVVTATVGAGVTGLLHNVAYVAPATTGEVPETNPLVVPTTTTDTATTPTNNDAQADISVASLVSVGDRVWLDTNRDGLQSEGEPAVPGVVVTLTDAAGGTRTTVTDDSGYYWFTDLTPGADYTLTFARPAGYVWTTQDAGGDLADKDAGTDSDVDPTTGAVAFTAPAEGTNAPGAPDHTDNPTLDAGLVQLVSMGDRVWVDTNRDGLQTDGESPLAGVTVNLYDATGTLVDSATTDPAGYYWFTDLLAGATYTVEFVKPAGYAFTPVVDANGTEAKDAGTDSDAPVTDGKVTFVAEAEGTNASGPLATDNPTVDAGFVPLVSIGDYVWFDRDRDGLQGDTTAEPVVPGVVVNLYAADGTTLVDTTTTDSAGFYVFTDLLAGATYVVEFVRPDGTVFTTQDAGADVSDGADSDADVTTGRVTVVAPNGGSNSATAPDDPTIDAGLVELVSIGDYVWWDIDRDGVQDDTEPPVEGVVVNLYDAAGEPVATTSTDANGFYAFTDLLGGADYVVEFVKPTGTTFTWFDEGSDDALDSDADADGLVPVTAPLTGANSATEPDDPTIDAGLVQLVSIGDYVWWDIDRDGVQDDTEPPVPGVTVNLYDETGGLAATAVTDADGFYSFTDLWAGAPYVVEFVKPAGASFTSQNSGSDDGTDSDADLATGSVAVTAPATGVNSATEPDDPTIDAGFVRLNLTLTKVLDSSATVQPGDRVTFTLTPHNEGPVDALAGWSVTEVLPAGLTLVSMSGSGYACSGMTCIAAAPLAAGADGPPVTVVATASGSGSLQNVAYVDRASGDVPETNPLGTPPVTGTDTEASPTDNDSEASLVVSVPLPHTGSEVTPLVILAATLIGLGGLLLLATRRRRGGREATR